MRAAKGLPWLAHTGPLMHNNKKQKATRPPRDPPNLPPASVAGTRAEFNKNNSLQLFVLHQAHKSSRKAGSQGRHVSNLCGLIGSLSRAKGLEEEVAPASRNLKPGSSQNPHKSSHVALGQK